MPQFTLPILPCGRHRVVAISGIDGTGKSRVATAIAEILGALYYYNPPEPFLSDRVEVDRTATPLERFRFYLTANEKCSADIAEIRCQKPVILDRYLYCTMAYHQAMGIPPDYIAAEVRKRNLIYPDQAFFFDCSDEDLRWKRIVSRGITANDERTRALVPRIRAEYLKYSCLTVIDTATMSLDELIEHTWRLIKEFEPLSG